MRIVRRLAGLVLVLAVFACARAPLKPVAPPPPTPAQRLASADALVREGCLDCLIDAFGQYDLLRTIPSAAEIGTAGAVRSAALIALRERELGMSDEGYSQRARSLMLGSPNQPAWLRTVLDIVDVLPAGGVTRAPTSDLDLDRSRALRLNHDAWRDTLRDLASASEFNAYVWLAFACASETRDVALDTIFAPTTAFKDAPLIEFRRAICRGLRPEPMRALIARDPRFIETTYYLGVVLAEQRVWPRTADVLIEAGQCLQAAELAYTQEIDGIRASHDPPERQAKKIARREQYIAKGRRYMATSWYDVAVAYYNLSKPAEARQFAEKVAGDDQFGERAREILTRLAKQP